MKIPLGDMYWGDDEMIEILQTKGTDLYLYDEKSNDIEEEIIKINPRGNIIFAMI